MTFILRALSVPTNTTIYLATEDGLMEIQGLMSVYTSVLTKSSLLGVEGLAGMHENTKVALDYYVAVCSDAYAVTCFGNMDKMVLMMWALEGLRSRRLFWNRRVFANSLARGLRGEELAKVVWKKHKDDFVMGGGYALPDYFCEVRL